MSEQNDLIVRLAERFPHCFVTGYARKPLAVGIYEQLLAVPDLNLTPHKLKRALGYYVGGGGYREGIVAGAQRLNLDGTVAGIVSDRDAEHAAFLLAQRRQKMEARKTAERDAVKAQRAAEAAKAVEVVNPQRLGIAGLRLAAIARRNASVGSQETTELKEIA
jgi:ProP effector